ncbi:DUF1109 domain-containing protein [Azospirillum sp. TSO22-1]|uniref:NrsF family protein n=1 Tax=Azospirillum sp. TSO22-1 TaxID=716789 RepID=UPI000D6079F8|nr:DUF1109 domain-containing protein [Azospirillum sp. TSO22-1]PWC31925.1 hypothetical protein TSO221_32155 [Azospirillum sp. TSO22-1]
MPATDDLIDGLVSDLRPVAPFSAVGTVTLGLGGGVLAATAVMIAGLGVRADLATAMGTAAHWIKLLYTLALGVCAATAMNRLARPGGSAPLAWAVAAAVFATVAGLAALQLAEAPPEARRPLVMGASADKCPWLILVLSLPIFAGAVWAMRRLAPTRLTVAGLAVGLAAGGLGACVYAFHCDETAIPFLALWYTLGIAAAGAVGAATGRLLLRW